MPSTAKDLTKAPRSMSRALASFERSIGGREALITAILSNPDLDDDQQRLVHLLSDPARDKTPIGEICYSEGVHIGHILQLFKAGRFARAQVEAIDKISERLPDIAADFASRALPYDIPCPDCGGLGELTTTIKVKGEKVDQSEPCSGCGGAKTITINPSLEHQRFAFDLGGLTPQKGGGGPGVNIGIFNANTKEASVTTDDLRNLRVSSDRLLYPGKYGGEDTSDVVDTSEVTDAEIIEISPSQRPIPTDDDKSEKGEGKSESPTKQEGKDVLYSRSSLGGAGAKGTGGAKGPPATVLPPPGKRDEG